MKHRRNPLPSPTILDRVTVILFLVLVAVVTSRVPWASAQNASSSASGSIRLEVAVQNSAGDRVSGASLTLEKSDSSKSFAAKTDEQGDFVFSGLTAGVYTLKAEKAEWGKAVADSVLLPAGETKQIRLVLVREDAVRKSAPNGASSDKAASSQPLQTPMQFADQPSFTVAGITDTNNIGLHASARDMGTSDALARDARALETTPPEGNSSGTVAERPARSLDETEKRLRAALANAPDSFPANHELGEFYCESKRYAEAIPLLNKAFALDSRNVVNAYDLALAYVGNGEADRAREQARKIAAIADTADGHRLLGDLEERVGDPLGAVREYERATQLEASEQNFFDWGTELLLHRAAEPAAEIFRKGLRAHPDSARLLTGLGAALYSSGAYEVASQRLCEAADLKPADTAPYIFLGKMEKAAPEILPCGEVKLAGFVAQQPGNALANYYYGLILWKKTKESGKSAALEEARLYLEKAVALDPKFDEAYLQLGIVHADGGDFSHAIAAYQRAIAANPRLAEAHYRLSLAYKRTGEETQAQQEMQVYKEIEKSDGEALERQQRELQQFLITLKGQSAGSVAH
jgi:tetratricopeptide (TPR) repeat protein